MIEIFDMNGGRVYASEFLENEPMKLEQHKDIVYIELSREYQREFFDWASMSYYHEATVFKYLKFDITTNKISSHVLITE